jgi:hypothetical protein
MSHVWLLTAHTDNLYLELYTLPTAALRNGVAARGCGRRSRQSGNGQDRFGRALEQFEVSSFAHPVGVRTELEDRGPSAELGKELTFGASL